IIGETTHVLFYLDLMVNLDQAISRVFQFISADIFLSVKNLPLNIGKIDLVEIDNTNGPNAGSRQIKRSRRSKSSCPDAQDARSFESILPLGRNLGHDEMTRVTLQFFNIQSHRFA